MEATLKIWKPIKGYENEYLISDEGEIKGMERFVKHRSGVKMIKEHILAKRMDRSGYWTVRLSKDGKDSTFLVHRLLAGAFLSNLFNYREVNHINGIKEDNSIENLEWVSHSQNVAHAYKTGLIGIKKNCVEILNLCTGEMFLSIKAAATYHSINYSTCKNYLNGHRPNPTCLRYKEKLKVA